MGDLVEHIQGIDVLASDQRARVARGFDVQSGVLVAVDFIAIASLRS